MGRASIKPVYVGDQIEKYTACIEAFQAVREMPRLEVAERLKEFQLADFEIELIFDRFYDELTFTKIVKKRGWTSAGSASHAFQQALRKLRKSGFSFK